MKLKSIDEGIEVFRKLQDEVHEAPTAKIVIGDSELLDSLNGGWELIRELERDKFLLKKES